MDFTLERLHENDKALIVLKGPKRIYTCGRGKENDILCLSLIVSRKHCVFMRKENTLSIMDLQSSNGIYINGKERKTLQTIELSENDVIGIGSPDIDPSNDTLFVYKVSIIKSLILDEEESSTISKTILNNSAPGENIPVCPLNPVLNGNKSRENISPVNRDVRKRRGSESSCDMTVPSKTQRKSNFTCNNKDDCRAGSSKGINSNLSCDNQRPHSSSNINNLKIRQDTTDLTSDDEIEIIHTLLAKKKKKNATDHKSKSAKCLNNSNESNNSNVNDRENPNLLRTDDQANNYETDLQMTDDERVHTTAVECDRSRDKSPIKLKKIKHEPKMRFSLIDVVDLSDDEEGVFPYSQLFDIKYEDNTEIKQECANDEEQNIEKIGLLNVDDEVVILTDSEDEANPWLERLSRSQLLNEDIKPISCDVIIKDEIDLGIWDDELLNTVEQTDVPCISQAPYNEEISPEPRVSVDVETKNKKGNHSINLPITEVDAMDADDARPFDDPTKDVNKSKQIIDFNINDKSKQKIDAKRAIELVKQTIKSVKQKLNIQVTNVDAMDADKIGFSNDSSVRSIDESKRKTDAKQSTELDKQTMKSAKQKLIAPATRMDAMDIDEADASNDPSIRSIDEIKRKKGTKRSTELDKQTMKSTKQKLIAPDTRVDAMDINDTGASSDPSMRSIDEIKRKKGAKRSTELDKQTIKNTKQKLIAPATRVDAMDIDEAGASNDPSMRSIDEIKRKKGAKRSTELDKQTMKNTKQKLITPATRVDAMDVDEAGSYNDPSMRSIDETKQKTYAKRDIEHEKQTIETIKQKLIAKSTKKFIPVIEPLSLPLRKKRTNSKDRATKESKENVSKLKEKINDNFYSKKQKDRKEKSIADSSPSSETKPGTSISKDEKKKIIEQRKMKLKEIAAEEKRLAAENDQNIKRRNKARAKISLKNRGDFLISEQEPQASKSLPDKSAELRNSSDDQFNKQSTNKADIVKKSATSMKKIPKLHRKTEVSKDTVNNIAASLQQSLHLDNQNAAFEETTRNFESVNNNKRERSSSNVNTDLTAKVSELRGNRSSECSSTGQKENFSPNCLKSGFIKSSIKSSIKPCIKSGIKPKKNLKVSFSDKVDIIEYEIEQRNTLKKMVGKDAPIPTNKLARAPVTYADWSPKLEEFLLRIFMWNPVWLEEQRRLKLEPPVVSENELQAMRLSYESYKHYYDVAMPLLLLEMWCTMTKDFETASKNMQRPTLMGFTVENSITCTPIPSTNLFLTTMMFEVLISREDFNKQNHPVYGDLIYLEYVRDIDGKPNFHKIFAYVTNMHLVIITDFTHYNRDLKNYVKNPYSVITYTLLTRPLEHNISINRVQRVRTVTYLRPSLRMVQALQYLPHSSLLKLIVNPKVEDYQLALLDEQFTPSSLVTKDDLNPKQLEAVFKVTDAVLKKEAKLCFIQGPPGTGKSKVIVNLVTQILYGKRQDKKSLRILVCAPSNAAIDEIVLRLLKIRSTLKHDQRFNMVRIGRTESMHGMAKNISVTELGKRYLIKMTKPTSSCGNNEDIAILQARVNSLNIELKNQNIDETKRNVLTHRLHETLLRYEFLKSGKPIDEISSKDRAKYQRMSENIVLAGANVIACTLSSCYTNQMESIFGGYKERISVCIVDEATQSCEAETLIPLMLGVNTLVLVGDPNQLPATILNQRAKKLGLDQSVFSRMQKVFKSQSKNPIIMLDTQYRMEYAISYWPNKYFYGGKLKNEANYKTDFPFHHYRVLYHNFFQNDDKFSNTTEAEFVSNIVYTMFMFGKWQPTSAPISLGILTPYNNQRTLVLNKINEKISTVPGNIKAKINFEVNTVDGFQGQERDVIIMSCVRSNGIGFLSDKQRLCVALTRAKRSLILCGNFDTFMKDKMWKALLNDARDRGILCQIDANARPVKIRKFIVK